jgi:hypothetical protein
MGKFTIFLFLPGLEMSLGRIFAPGFETFVAPDFDPDSGSSRFQQRGHALSNPEQFAGLAKSNEREHGEGGRPSADYHFCDY